MAARLYPPLSMGKAAALMGFVGPRSDRAALRYLRAREGRDGPFLIRRGTDAKVQFFVTLPVLRQHCPELFDKRDEGVTLLTSAVGLLKDEIAALRRRVRALETRATLSSE